MCEEKRASVNLTKFNMINEQIDKSKTLIKHISCECRCELDGKNCTYKQICYNDKFQGEYKKQIKHHAYKEDYPKNRRTFASECKKDCNLCRISKRLHMHEKSFYNLVLTCDEIADTPENKSISSKNKMKY